MNPYYYDKLADWAEEAKADAEHWAKTFGERNDDPLLTLTLERISASLGYVLKHAEALDRALVQAIHYKEDVGKTVKKLVAKAPHRAEETSLRIIKHDGVECADCKGRLLYGECPAGAHSVSYKKGKNGRPRLVCPDKHSWDAEYDSHMKQKGNDHE